MARKKLSDAQRVAIRKEILRRLGAGASKTSISRELAKKYGVSSVTIRWYLKTLDSAGGVRPPAPPRGRAGRGASPRLLDIVRNVSEDGLERALAAKKLFVELQAKLEQSERLRRTEREIRRSLAVLAASARKLEARLHRMTMG